MPGNGPRLGFVIVGAQKCGTSALAHFLSQHPEIGMASPTEAHIFDAPDYVPGTPAAEIDRCHDASFAHCADARIWGEATPIYMFMPGIAAELSRYNPRLKLIVLLRDPVERAISNYHMERDRGAESLPLWLALLSEPVRRWLCRDARPYDSALRTHSYRGRGLYSKQLRNLFRYFPRDSILVLFTRDLLDAHDAVFRRVCDFLGVPNAGVTQTMVREGDYRGKKHRLVSGILRLSFLAESRRLRATLGNDDGCRGRLPPKIHG